MNSHSKGMLMEIEIEDSFDLIGRAVVNSLFGGQAND
jgi:hypothetical protein